MAIGIIIGSVREGRAADAVAAWVAEQAKKREQEYTVIDLKDYNIPPVSAPVIPGMANKQYDDENVTAWSKAIDACEGFIFITPEYNHSVPGPFKNAVDSLAGEWQGKPVGYVGYGAVGGVRAVEAWRLVTANFSMPNTRGQLDFNLFTEFGENGLNPNERREGEMQALFDELEALVVKNR